MGVFLTPGVIRAQDEVPANVPDAAPPDVSPDASMGNQPDDQTDDQGASFQTFYDQLGDQGTWIQTDDYGYVFQPAVTDPDWAPYTVGHWVYTDDGWAWASDEPWGWATYHYGRWANIDGMGWVWVPGYRWAPAWVSWRYGGGYAGWAPLPPETLYGAEYGEPNAGAYAGFHFGNDVDVSFHIGAGLYNFVSVGDLGENDYRGRYLDRSRNYVVINNTTNITNFTVHNSGAGAGRGGAFAGITAGGPPIAAVNARARQHVQTVSLTAAAQPGRSTLQGNTLAVYAPRVNPATVGQARPSVVGQTIQHPAFNRGDSITKPLVVTASVRPAQPTAEAIQAAQEAQAKAPAHAKIATTRTPVRSAPSSPFTALKPVAVVHPSAQVAPRTNPATAEIQHTAAVAAPSPKPAPVVSHPETENSSAQAQAQHDTEVRAQQAAAAQQERTQQAAEQARTQTSAQAAQQAHAQQAAEQARTQASDQAAQQERAQQAAEQARTQAADQAAQQARAQQAAEQARAQQASAQAAQQARAQQAAAQAHAQAASQAAAAAAAANAKKKLPGQP